MTQRVRTRSEGTSQTTDLAKSSGLSHISMQAPTPSTEIISKTLIPESITSEAEPQETLAMVPAAETGETPIISPAAENKGTLTTSPAPQTRETPTTSPSAETTSLTKIINSNFMGDIINPMDTHDTRGSPKGSGTSTVGTSIGSDPTEVTFDTLPTEDSSEEARRIVIDLLTLAHTFTETESLFSDSSYPSKSSVPVLSTSQALSPAVPIPPKILMTYHTTHIEITESLSSESSSSSNSLAPALTTSQALSPDIWIPVKTLVAYSTAHIEPTNYSTEIETASPTFRTSDTDQRSTEGVTALSTSETSALPPSTEAKSHIPKATAFADASESASPATTLEATLPTSCTTERKTTATKASTHSGALGTVTSNPFKETSDPSVETSSHAEVSGSTEAGSAVGKVTSLAGPSASTSSPSEVAPIENFTYSVTFDTDSTTIGSFPISRRLPPSVHPTLANSSRDRNITSAKATTSPRTPMKPPTSMPTTASVKQTTGVSANGGFLLVRLSVASPEDLTEPRLAERLMKQVTGHLPGQENKLGAVAHACNPSYLGSRDQKATGWRAEQAKSPRPHLSQEKADMVAHTCHPSN
uniref:Mucin-20 n=1 Tax=Castor canadensis TaxID=51338 RepID=A0A8C0W3B6_CASCN